MAHLPNSQLERALSYDYTKPEQYYKGLILADEHDWQLPGKRKKEGILDMYSRPPETELCWSCGWSTYNELTSCYGSRVRIMHTRDNKGLWSIGSQWILRDEPNDDSLGNDYMTQKFLRAQTGLNIPLVKEMRLLSEPTDKIYFTLMSRAQGKSLYYIWHDLTPEQKLGYKNQLVDVIRQLRQFTSPVAQKVDGSALDDSVIGYCGRRHPPTCKKMGKTKDEWFEILSEELRYGLSMKNQTEDPMIIEPKLQELKDNFPDSEPYVLSHGDLNLSNIIVKDDRIEAIIDWESAGYYPWWFERWLMKASGPDDLVDPLWADLSPEMDEAAFSEQVLDKIRAVGHVWGVAEGDVKHPGGRTELLRPGFCQCRPYAGRFTQISLGNRLDHKLEKQPIPTPGYNTWWW